MVGSTHASCSHIFARKRTFIFSNRTPSSSFMPRKYLASLKDYMKLYYYGTNIYKSLWGLFPFYLYICFSPLLFVLDTCSLGLTLCLLLLWGPIIIITACNALEVNLIGVKYNHTFLLIHHCVEHRFQDRLFLANAASPICYNSWHFKVLLNYAFIVAVKEASIFLSWSLKPWAIMLLDLFCALFPFLCIYVARTKEDLLMLWVFLVLACFCCGKYLVLKYY